MTYFEERIQTPIKDDYDFIVCGGGAAGVSCAITAGRLGLRTLLLEEQGCLGGVWTSGLLSLILDVSGKSGLLDELKQRLEEEGALRFRPSRTDFTYDSESMKMLLEQLCLGAGVDLRLHTRVVSAVTDGNRVQGVITEGHSGREAFRSKLFADCTGNGDLAHRAGCQFDVGHPETGITQPATLIGIVSGVPESFFLTEETFKRKGSVPNEIRMREKEKLREIFQSVGVDPSYKTPLILKLPNPNIFAFMINHEYSVACDSSLDITNATINARKEIDTAVKSLRKKPSWEHLRLISTASHIGLREGRRIRGQYYLGIEDIISGRRFDDGICTVTFGIDIHDLDEEGSRGYSSKGRYVTPYHLPFRSLISYDFENLGMAGRCVSGDFYAHASYRVTGNAIPMGEALAIGAKLALSENDTFTNVDGSLVGKEMHQRGYEI